MNYLALAVGVILTLTGLLNIVFFERTVKRLTAKGRKPSEQSQRLNKYISVVTFILGIYISVSTLINNI